MKRTLVLDKIAEILSDQCWSHTNHRHKLIFMFLLFKSIKFSFLLVEPKLTIADINNYHEPDTVPWVGNQSKVGLSPAL